MKVLNYNEFINESGILKKIEVRLDNAEPGAIATGGGYKWIKKNSKTWKSKAKLAHSAQVASMIGGFKDFKIVEPYE